MSNRTSFKLFLLLALIGAPVATYGVIMLVTDGLGIVRDNWGWLIVLIPPLFTMIVGRAMRQTALRIAFASVGSIATTFALIVVIVVISLSSNPDVFQ
jgi:hypothetical protein